MNWHQLNAARNAYRLRRYAAHIRASDYIATGQSLCGQSEPKVYVLEQHAHNPDNHTCKKCLQALEKLK
jgi:hypothetical protein